VSVEIGWSQTGCWRPDGDPVSATPDLVRILELLERVETHPKECGAEARLLLTHTEFPNVVAAAQRCVGLAERTRGRFGDAREWFEASVATAEAADLQLCAAQSQVGLASCLAASGNYHEALALLNVALPRLDEKSMAAAKNYVGFVLRRTEHPDEAMVAFAEAAAHARSNSQDGELAKILNNRSVLLVEMGDMAGAAGDLRNAVECFDRAGQGLYAAKAEHNLGWLLARQGHVAEALRVYADADARGGEAMTATSTGARDRAELYLTARLFRESLHSARLARELASRDGFRGQLPEIDLLLGRVLACLSSWEKAAESFSSSEHLSREHGRFFTARVARWCFEVSLLRATGRGPNGLASSPAELASRSERGDLHIADLVDVGFSAIMGQLGLAAEDPRNDAIRHMVSAGAHSENATSRVQALVIRTADMARSPGATLNDVAFAVDELLNSICEHFATIPSQELRTLFVDSLRVEPVLVDCAVLFDHPTLYLEWLERLRTSTNGESRIDDDSAHAARTEDLLRRRRYAGEPRERESKPGPVANNSLRDQSQTEFEIRLATWSATRNSKPRFDSDEVFVRTRGIGEPSETLLCYAMSTSDLVVLQQHANDRSLIRLSSTNQIGPAIDAVRIAVSGLLSRNGRSPTPLETQNVIRCTTKIERTLQRLNDLVTPPNLPSGPVAIVGNGVLAAIPWQLLQSLAGRRVATYPTIQDWLSPKLSLGPRAGIVCGPGLKFGEIEADAIAALYDNPIVLTGPQATVESICALMAGVDTLHVIAHGSRRTDSAFFSGIELYDGALTGYDLARLNSTPRRVILSCCDLGAANSKGLSSSFGLMSTLRNRGSNEIAAPVILVDDAETVGVMVSVHRYLRRGWGLADALLETLTNSKSNKTQLTAGSFNTMGR
jgi:tetratricopeptide (TPR) repeat protein